jgi:FAD synthetase
MKRVMVFGSYDLLHDGHKYLFKRAKKLGDELIVVVARDSTIERVKGESPLYGERERLGKVEEVDDVDRAVLGYKGNKMRIVEKIMPDVIALGYDQNSFVERLEKEIENRGWGIKVVRLGSFKPNKFKSSLLKKG